MDVWIKMENKRSRDKKTFKRRTEKLRDLLATARREFTYENERILECLSQFDNFQEDFQNISKEERVINDFVKMLAESTAKIEISALDRIYDQYERNFQADFEVL